MRSAGLVFLGALLSTAVWANGEIIVEPREGGGIIVPDEKTSVQVVRERLTIDFGDDWPSREGDVLPALQPAKVQAKYFLHNPSDEDVTLHIGFPLEGTANFRSSPVLLDDQVVRFTRISHAELLERSRPELEAYVAAVVGTAPEFVELMDDYRRARNDGDQDERDRRRREVYRLARELWGRQHGEAVVFSLLTHDLEDLERAVEATGGRHLLPAGRWQCEHEVLDPVRLTPTEPGPQAYVPRWLSSVELLTFSITISAHAHQELAVAYEQPPWNAGIALPGPRSYQLQYLAKVAQHWGSFGPIDVELRVPKGPIFGCLPKAERVRDTDDQRIYRLKMNGPQSNIHIVLSDPLWWNAGLRVNDENRYWERPVLLRNGRAFVRPRDVVTGWRKPLSSWRDGWATVELGPNRLKLKPGSKEAALNDESVQLSLAPIVSKGKLYAPMEALALLFRGGKFEAQFEDNTRTLVIKCQAPNA